jgi:hypothetical protein
VVAFFHTNGGHAFGGQQAPDPFQFSPAPARLISLNPSP